MTQENLPKKPESTLIIYIRRLPYIIPVIIGVLALAYFLNQQKIAEEKYIQEYWFNYLS